MKRIQNLDDFKISFGLTSWYELVQMSLRFVQMIHPVPFFVCIRPSFTIAFKRYIEF